MPDSSAWLVGPTHPVLAEGEVHVWRVPLDVDRDQLARLEVGLADDEHARAFRFVFAIDRDRFVSSQGFLRVILGRYLDQPPSAIQFRREREGKPRLRDPRAHLRFNLSHSHGLAVYAFAQSRELGVDIEAIRSDVARDEIAARFFSAKELAELRSLPPNEQDAGFFFCWTRKEAYVKARGSGLGIPLDSFDVSLTPGIPEHLVSVDSGRWMLRAFQPADGYAGAVVAEGRDWNLRLWDGPRARMNDPVARQPQ